MAIELLRSLTPDEWDALIQVSSSNGVPEPTVLPIRRKRRPYTRSVVGAQVERLYAKEQQSLRTVSKATGLPIREVKAILRKRGVALRRHKVKAKTKTKRGRTGARSARKTTGGRLVQVGNTNRLLDDAGALELYKTTPSLTVRELARVSGISYWHLLDVIRNAGVLVRRHGRPRAAKAS